MLGLQFGSLESHSDGHNKALEANSLVSRNGLMNLDKA